MMRQSAMKIRILEHVHFTIQCIILTLKANFKY